MTSFALKLIAYLTMFSDHVGKLFFPDTELFVIIGRISFPLFAFLVAEGASKTKDEKKYFNRLLIFAFISQIPFMLFLYFAGANFMKLNILFTLSAGLGLIILYKRKLYFLSFVFFLFIGALNEIIRIDYGMYGVLMVLASYIFINRNKVEGSILLIILTTLFSFKYTPGDIVVNIQFFAMLAIIPILIYTGDIGKRISKWWFYIIYPVHFLILVGIYLLIK